MTVPSTKFREDYAGNGSATSFPYAFRIFKNTDLVVTKTDNSGNETTLTLGTDYTVTGAGSYNGGAVVLTTALPTSYRLTIERVLAIRQDTDLRNQGEFLAETHEDAFDRLTMIVQRLAGYLGMGQDGTLRTLLLGTGDVDGAGAFRARGNRISGLGNPVSGQDAVTKAWFDQAVTTSVNQAANSAASAAASAAAAEDSEQASLVIATQFGDMATAITQTEAARDAALSAKTAAQSSATSAASSATSASTAKSQAEAARDAAQLSSGVYPDTATGIAGVADGRYFSVPATDGVSLILYRRVGAVAVEQSRYPSAAAVLAMQNDPARPREIPSDDLLVALTDKYGARTWLEARKGDGGPTEWAISLLLAALGLSKPDTPGVLFAVTDSESRMTDLTVRDTDGQVPDWVIQRWASRLSLLLATSNLSSDVYVRGAEVLPFMPNMGSISAWGSSTINEIAGNFSAMAGTFGAAYYNGGQSGETASEIAARLGAIPALITVPSGSIPASGSVSVTCSNVPATSFFRATAGKLNGVDGTLSVSGGAFVFTRTAAGSTVPTSGAFPFVPTDGNARRADATILNLGKNDLSNGDTAETVIAKIDACYDWLSPFVRRVIVIGHFVNVGIGASSATRTRTLAVNAALAARYGRQYFDILGYLTGTQVWIDTGITPNSTDLSEQALGNIPPSLTRDGSAHMNDAARAAVTAKIRQKIIELGWYK